MITPRIPCAQPDEQAEAAGPRRYLPALAISLTLRSIIVGTASARKRCHLYVRYRHFHFLPTNLIELVTYNTTVPVVSDYQSPTRWRRCRLPGNQVTASQRRLGEPTATSVCARDGLHWAPTRKISHGQERSTSLSQHKVKIINATPVSYLALPKVKRAMSRRFRCFFRTRDRATRNPRGDRGRRWSPVATAASQRPRPPGARRSPPRPLARSCEIDVSRSKRSTKIPVGPQAGNDQNYTTCMCLLSTSAPDDDLEVRRRARWSSRHVTGENIPVKRFFVSN